MNIEIETTSNLWRLLKRMGNITDTYYDKNIIDDLKVELQITCNFETALQSISPERLLTAFFNVLAPLSEMYTDILNLFERCKANSTEDNIEIEFDTEKFGSKRLNISHFTYAKKVIKEIKKLCQRTILSDDSMEYLLDISSIGEFRVPDVHNESYKKWDSEYMEGYGVNEWPTIELDFENQIKSFFLHGELTKAYDFWKRLFLLKSIPVPRDGWYHFLSDEYSDSYNKELLWPEVNFCLGHILRNLYLIIENYQQLSPNQQNRVREILQSFLDALKSEDGYVKELISTWIEFLKLPVWKYRYELYSIWIFSQIVLVFPDELITFHVKRGVLSFPFSATHLATLKLNKKVFEFWGELRTEAIIQPIGKSRVKAIQPDYSVVCGNGDDPMNTIIAVECKQYKKSHTKNFSETIIDYAYNRPNAMIVLADYGEINVKQIDTRLNKTIQKRTILFSKCRPDTKIASYLSNRIQGCIYNCADVFKLNTGDIACFLLYWGEEPLDLDLYLKHGEADVLCYNCDEVPGAEYIGDYKKGYGPEEIRVKHWNDGIYGLWVHNFSGEVSLAKSGAILLAFFKGTNQILKIPCPKEGNYKWWNILRINTTQKTIEVTNQLLDEMT